MPIQIWLTQVATNLQFEKKKPKNNAVPEKRNKTKHYKMRTRYACTLGTCPPMDYGICGDSGINPPWTLQDNCTKTPFSSGTDT